MESTYFNSKTVLVWFKLLLMLRNYSTNVPTEGLCQHLRVSVLDTVSVET